MTNVQNTYPGGNSDDHSFYRLNVEKLPAGSFDFAPAQDVAPTKTERSGEFVEVMIPLGDDHTASLIFEREAIDANPELFEKVED